MALPYGEPLFRHANLGVRSSRTAEAAKEQLSPPIPTARLSSSTALENTPPEQKGHSPLKAGRPWPNDPVRPTFQCRFATLPPVLRFRRNGGSPMTKEKPLAQTAEEKREAQRKERLSQKAKNEELDEALEDSFPASDPPSMTQPETEVGAPSRTRKPDQKSGER